MVQKLQKIFSDKSNNLLNGDCIARQRQKLNDFLKGELAMHFQPNMSWIWVSQLHLRSSRAMTTELVTKHIPAHCIVLMLAKEMGNFTFSELHCSNWVYRPCGLS